MVHHRFTIQDIVDGRKRNMEFARFMSVDKNVAYRLIHEPFLQSCLYDGIPFLRQDLVPRSSRSPGLGMSPPAEFPRQNPEYLTGLALG